MKMNKPDIISVLIGLMIENQKIAKLKSAEGKLNDYDYARHTGYEWALRDAIKTIQDYEENENE